MKLFRRRIPLRYFVVGATKNTLSEGFRCSKHLYRAKRRPLVLSAVVRKLPRILRQHIRQSAYSSSHLVRASSLVCVRISTLLLPINAASSVPYIS